MIRNIRPARSGQAGDRSSRVGKARRVLAATVVGVVLVQIAGGATTFNPPGTSDEPVRDTVKISVNPGAQIYTRSTSTFSTSAAFNQQNANSASTILACTGASTPFSEVIIKDPNGAVAFELQSPEVSGVGLLGLQSWRGGPWSQTVDLTGKPAGIYTVETRIHNKVRSAHNLSTSPPNGIPCTTGTPTNAGVAFPNPPTNGFVAGPVIEIATFEFRPWQQTFVDYFGGGAVRFNVTPEEFTWEVNGTKAPLIKGAAADAAMSFFWLPQTGGLDFENPEGMLESLLASLFTPPADPTACVADPMSCLPATAVPCNPSAGCEPRIAFINYSAGSGLQANQLIGFFDLDTRAFVAYARTGGKQRVLASGGPVLDELLHGAWSNLVDQARAAGIDLPTLLNQPIELSVPIGEENVTVTISLLNGAQITNSPIPASPAGPLAVAAGLIIHIGAWSGPDLGLGNGSAYGYTVQSAEDLPALPPLPSIGALLVSGGKIRHVVGNMPDGGGEHVIALSADTSPGEPNGLPIWLPLVSGAGTVSDSGVEFIGDDLLVLDFELCILGECSGAGTVIGTGLAMFPRSPLDGLISIGDLPLIWQACTLAIATVTCPPGGIEAITTIDGQVADITAQLFGNPTVQDVLAQADPILDQLLGEALGTVPGT